MCAASLISGAICANRPRITPTSARRTPSGVTTFPPRTSRSSFSGSPVPPVFFANDVKLFMEVGRSLKVETHVTNPKRGHVRQFAICHTLPRCQEPSLLHAAYRSMNETPQNFMHEAIKLAEDGIREKR